MRDFGIDPAVWRRLNQLLDEALDLPPELRADWLASLPPEAEPLKPRLTTFSRTPERGVDDFEPCRNSSRTFTTSREGEIRVSGDGGASGEMVGAYRLSKLLGEGGMGAVWLAERTDGMLQRPVALKLPRGVYSRPELLRPPRPRTGNSRVAQSPQYRQGSTTRGSPPGDNPFLHSSSWKEVGLMNMSERTRADPDARVFASSSNSPVPSLMLIPGSSCTGTSSRPTFW